MILLNIGCFQQMFPPPWQNIDILPMPVPDGFVFHQRDIMKGLPYDDGSVDLIYASHFIEHLPFDDAIWFLSQAFKALKPGFWIRLTTPDLEKFLDFHSIGEMDKFAPAQPEVFKQVKAQSLKLSMIMFGNIGYHQHDEYRGHWMVYDFEGLLEILERVGFVDITHYSSHCIRTKKSLTEFFEYGGSDTWVEGDEAHTLIVEARKPELMNEREG